MIGGMVVPSGAIVSAQVAGVETRDQGSTGDEGDHLDDWFTRRLESHGIPLRGRGSIIPRVLTLIGLAIALLGMFWALSAVRNSTTSAGSPPATTAGQGGTTGGGGTSTSTGTTPTQAPWQKVTVDVLNGYGGASAASTAASTLQSAGFTVGATGNAGTATKYTVVVFTGGHRDDAKLIAKRLKVGFEPAAVATGVPQTAVKNGVAIVVGRNGLPASV